MKTLQTALISLCCCFIGLKSQGQVSPGDTSEYNKVTHIAEKIRTRYAPDKRTALFELHPASDNGSPYRITTTETKAIAHFTQLLAENHIPVTKVTINLLPDGSLGRYVSGIVNLSVANLRVAPRNQAELASQVLLGTPVDLLQRQGDYYRVRTPEGYIAWIAASSLTPKSAQGASQWKAANKVIVTADFGHSYTSPDERSLRVSDLVMGDLLIAKAETDGFVQVQYPDGRGAYVRRTLVRPFDAWLGSRHPTADSVLAVAKTMMGVPYLWGGTSVKGVDCSGFTKTAYYMNGVVIPRDASQQIRAGRPIDILSHDTLDTEKALRNLQPADLLFFASGKGRTPDAPISHVALYLGNGEFIHAAGTVRINSMRRGAANYRDFESRTLVAARRYIGQADPALQPLSTHQSYR